MKKTSILTLMVWCLALLLRAQAPTASLRGTVTDPSGALVPGALVQLRGQGPEHRATTDGNGQYSFIALPAGKYTVRIIAKGFTINQKQDFEITSARTL